MPTQIEPAGHDCIFGVFFFLLRWDDERGFVKVAAKVDR